MQTISENSVEYEISSLPINCPVIPCSVQKIRQNEYYINIAIPMSLLISSTFEFMSNINFLLHIEPTFPYKPPKLYCLTTFSFPIIADGRDILSEVISSSWDNQIKIYQIINKIPIFLLNFMQNDELKKQKTVIGKYYLDNKYDYNILSKLPVYFKKVREHINVSDNKYDDEGRYLLISDIFFCLFEYDFFSLNTCKLIFWSNIKALVSMREYVGNNICEFEFNIKYNKKYKLKLVIEDGEYVINLIMNNLKHFGIDYSVSTKEQNNTTANKELNEF